MTGRTVVLPSPFLPPAAYEPLLIAMRERGYAPDLADSSAPVSGPALVARWRRAAAGADLLVAHSNAGYLASLVRPQPGTPIVHVDAALPPARGTTRLAPRRFRDELAPLADGSGLLPPWTRWWPRPALEEVIPASLFDGIDAACPRVPLGYLDSVVRAPHGWSTGPNAYLAFGRTYADELEFARALGWPTAVMAGSHLHFLRDPAGVAEAVHRLARSARSIGQESRSGGGRPAHTVETAVDPAAGSSDRPDQEAAR